MRKGHTSFAVIRRQSANVTLVPQEHQGRNDIGVTALGAVDGENLFQAAVNLTGRSEAGE